MGDPYTCEIVYRKSIVTTLSCPAGISDPNESIDSNHFYFSLKKIVWVNSGINHKWLCKEFSEFDVSAEGRKIQDLS